MAKVVIAYIPVLHEGYYAFLKNHADAEVIYVLDRTIVTEADWLRKELRALDPQLVAAGIAAWRLGPKVETISTQALADTVSAEVIIIMPNEDISHILSDKYLASRTIIFDPIFLRWDRRRSESKDEVNPDHRISKSEFDKSVMLQAHTASFVTSDIWRNVGSAVVKDGKVLATSANSAQPTANTPWAEGDPRGNYGKGVAIEMSVFHHAEAALIARAAKAGFPLEGTDLYVTVFPCPPCAMLIANSGIKRLFYAGGYSVLHGEAVLKANNVELIKVDVEFPPDRTDIYRPYPEK